MVSPDVPVLRARGLIKEFPVGGSLGRKSALRAVDQVDLELHAGKTHGLVGESGSGKSTLGKLLMRLLTPTAGTVEFEGQDITRADRRQLRPVHRRLRMVFQDPYSSLDPRMTIGDIVAEPLRLHRVARGRALDERVAALFDQCGLSPAWRHRYPHELSGGQRQRVGIARALSLQPSLLIADEPVSALDVSVQAGILNLLKDLQQQLGFTCLFISHDLSVVEFMSDRIAVMYLGKIVEEAKASELFVQPRHPYTQALLSAEPPLRAAPDAARRVVLSGDLPSALDPPAGCLFHTRCPVAEPTCRVEQPELATRGDDEHLVACHLVLPDGTGPRL
ncbi:ABC transporter ATP-binding protein [Micromonospora sp. NPDC005087]|uniref:ABC transporter ATP-binding protein n=1 Tax=Micromonospora sp. NPDC005087 TaxID=3364225 RepID=UPI00369DD6E7